MRMKMKRKIPYNKKVVNNTYNNYKSAYQMDNNQYRAIMSFIWFGFILGLCAIFNNGFPLLLLFVYLMLIV